MRFVCRRVISFRTRPLTRYESGFRMSFDDLARVLDPAGEDYDRPMTELIDSLRSARKMRSEASNRRSRPPPYFEFSKISVNHPIHRRP
jgi:hypothetical protein